MRHFHITLLFAFIAIIISACSVKKQPTEDEERMTKTAKINTQLGLVYLERNDINRSKQKLLLALKQDPNIPEPWYSMAYYLETTGNKRLANDYYLKAISLAPERGDTHNNYGTFLCRAGKYRESINQFNLAVKAPDYLTSGDAYENAGLCALKIPNKKLAARFFAAALKQDSTRPISLLKLAEINFQLGNHAAARTKLRAFLAVSQPTTQSRQLSAKLYRSAMLSKAY